MEPNVDPLGLLSGIMEAESLPTWSQIPIGKVLEPKEEKESPFPVNPDINEKVCLW